jgi:hypothetical protein
MLGRGHRRRCSCAYQFSDCESVVRRSDQGNSWCQGRIRKSRQPIMEMWPVMIRKLDRLNENLNQILAQFEKIEQHVVRMADWTNPRQFLSNSLKILCYSTNHTVVGFVIKPNLFIVIPKQLSQIRLTLWLCTPATTHHHYSCIEFLEWNQSGSKLSTRLKS